MKLRYKIWDKNRNKMLHWGKDFGYITEHGIVLLNTGGMVMPPNAETLVYSGVHDVDNIEICEGDIVEVGYMGERFTGEIVFETGSFCVKIMRGSTLFDVGQIQELSNFEQIRFIGNKYEAK